MEASVWMDGIRNFFLVVDRFVYSLIGTIYEIILSIADARDRKSVV